MTRTHDVMIEVRFPRQPGETVADAVLRAGESLENAGFWVTAGTVDGLRRTLERDHNRERLEALENA